MFSRDADDRIRALAPRAGAADICERLDSLETKAHQGLGAAAAIACDFKAKLQVVTLAYDALVEDIIQATENKDRQFPTMDNADRAEKCADELCVWAESFVPDSASTQVGLSGQDKLAPMPYFVALAYAMRVKMDTCMVRSRGTVIIAERMVYLEACRSAVNGVVKRIRAAAVAIVSDASLLDVALNYHSALAIYVMPIASLQASAQMM